jgi:hypothetical protein
MEQTTHKIAMMRLAAQGVVDELPLWRANHEDWTIHLREVDHPERKARLRVGVRTPSLPDLGGRLTR